MTSAARVVEVISSFKCLRDTDIEFFLKERAVKFETLSKSRTFLLLDEERLSCGYQELLAYFTVSQQILKVGSLGLSNRQIKELDGFSSKRNGLLITEIPVFLIGQLAKNDSYSGIDGFTVLEYALSIIEKAQEKIGGRFVLVECRDIPHILRFYEKNAFKAIRHDSDQLIQLIRKLP